MIKIGITNIDKVIYQGRISKVLKGIDLIWEKVEPETLVYTKSGSSYYDISINNWSDLRPNKNYRFTTNKDGNYTINSNGISYPIIDKDVFTVMQNCDIKIRNTDYNFFDINIYETTDAATIII